MGDETEARGVLPSSEPPCPVPGRFPCWTLRAPSGSVAAHCVPRGWGSSSPVLSPGGRRGATQVPTSRGGGYLNDRGDAPGPEVGTEAQFSHKKDLLWRSKQASKQASPSLRRLFVVCSQARDREKRGLGLQGGVASLHGGRVPSDESGRVQPEKEGSSLWG